MRIAHRIVLPALIAALLGAAPASARITVLADHLARPRGLVVAPNGTLSASILGNGGPKCDGEGCFGGSGRIVAVGRDGELTTVARGLLTMRGRPDGFFSLGADQLAALPDGRLVTAVSAEFNGFDHKPPRQVPKALRPQAGHVMVITPGGVKQRGADIAAIEYRDDPDGEGMVSNPYGVATIGDTIYVADSAANDLLEVTGTTARVLTTFPHPSDDNQAVTDALAAGPDGALYVGEYTGGAQAPHTAHVWRVVPGQPPAVFASGLTTITALAFGPDGSLYATEFRPGDVVRIAADGTRTKVATGLHYPGGIAVASDGAIFVSNWTVAGNRPARHGELRGHTGQIVRLTP
jgi:sugar lactone lactonase YvrE